MLSTGNPSVLALGKCCQCFSCFSFFLFFLSFLSCLNSENFSFPTSHVQFKNLKGGANEKKLCCHLWFCPRWHKFKDLKSVAVPSRPVIYPSERSSQLLTCWVLKHYKQHSVNLTFSVCFFVNPRDEARRQRITPIQPLRGNNITVLHTLL